MVHATICTVLTTSDLEIVQKILPFSDLFEVRIDLIGPSWPVLAKSLNKPWIACCPSKGQGGQSELDLLSRLAELHRAVELGATIVDLEFETPGISGLVQQFKQVNPQILCLLSWHDWLKTPDVEYLEQLGQDMRQAGADICKIVTMAIKPEDNETLLSLAMFANSRYQPIVTFAMGELGIQSRLMCPLLGGIFTYACAELEKASAPGQISVVQMRERYRQMSTLTLA